MDLIKELHFVITLQPDVDLEKLFPPNSKVQQLFKLVVDNKVSNDEQAAQIIYNTQRPDKKYLMLKRSLVLKLSDLVFQQQRDDSLGSNYETIRFIVSKELLIVEKLLAENVYHNPTKIISRIEHLAEQYFLIDLQLEAAIKFRSIYALKGFPAETAVYNTKVSHLQKLNNFLINSQGFWEVLYSKTKFWQSKTDELNQEASAYAEKTGHWLEEHFNPFIKLYHIRISLVAAYQTYQISKIWQLLHEYEQLLQEYSFLKSKHILLDLTYQKALFYRHSNALSKAQEYIEKCLESTEYQAFNRFLIQELHFDILLKKDAYLEALEVYLEVVQVSQFQFLDPYDRSVWQIREAYLHFIFKALNMPEELNSRSLIKFQSIEY